MKKHLVYLWTALFILSIVLAACSSAATTTVSTSESLSVATRLAAGTLKLEGTDQAVTAGQTTELLTLWQAYQSLSASDTAAPAELDALVSQIQATMTTDQVQAIDKMQINTTTVNEILQSAQPAITSSASTTSSSSTSSQMTAGGGPGGPMDGGGAPGGDIGAAIGDPSLGTSAQATSAAASQASTQTSNVSPMLLNALIQMLKTRSQTAG